jgi:hypothetical protein
LNFVDRERPHLRPYLHSLIGRDGVQYFERFVQERLDSLNSETVIIDEFEREIQQMGIRRNNHGGLVCFNYNEISTYSLNFSLSHLRFCNKLFLRFVVNLANLNWIHFSGERKCS